MNIVYVKQHIVLWDFWFSQQWIFTSSGWSGNGGSRVIWNVDIVLQPNVVSTQKT